MRKVGDLDTVIVSDPIISLFHNSPLKLFHLEVYMTMQNLAVDKMFFLGCDAGCLPVTYLWLSKPRAYLQIAVNQAPHRLRGFITCIT